jgi:pimeloyl-ACP methyl ester carboxylesterase
MPQTPPEPITMRGAAGRLSALLDVPDGDLRGGVVVVHGWGGCRVGPHRILVEAARSLNARGLATLRFDLGGRGQSEGDPLATDLDSMIDDATLAVEVLRARIGTLPIGMLGMCSGGNVALAVAALHDGVDAVATWSTYPFQEQKTGKQESGRRGHFLKVYLSKALRPSTWARLVRGRVNLKLVRRVLFRKAEQEGEGGRNMHRSRREVVAPLTRYAGRVLFLYGGSDPEAGQAETVFRAFCGENGIDAEFQTVEGANHNFYSLDWKRQVIERTTDWLASRS